MPVKIYNLVRYIICKSFSGLVYTTTLIIFYNNSQIANILPIVIIQEFLYSYFKIYVKNKYITEGKLIFKNSLYIVIFVSYLFILPFIEVKFDYIFFFLSALLFPKFLILQITNEKEDVEQTVRKENISAIYSSITIFLISFILYYYNLQWDGILLMRFLLIFCYNIYTLKNIQVCNNYRLSNDIIPIIYIISLMFYKLILINNGLLQENTYIKYFIILYDIIAMTYGYIERTIIANINNHKKRLNYLAIGIILYTSFITILGLASNAENIILITIVNAFLLSSSYSFFNINVSKKEMLLNSTSTFICGLLLFINLNYALAHCLYLYLLIIYKKWKLKY